MKNHLCIFSVRFVHFYFAKNKKGRTLAQTDIDDLKNLPIPREISQNLQDKAHQIVQINDEFLEESSSFIEWICRRWSCEISELTLKTHLQKYWEYDFDELLRISKKNKSKIDGEIKSRDFQETLKEEWDKSIKTLRTLEGESDKLRHEIDAIVFDLYNLNTDEVSTVLDSLETPDYEKTDILTKFREISTT